MAFFISSHARSQEEIEALSKNILFNYQPSSVSKCKGYYTEKKYDNSAKHVKITSETLEILENNISILEGNVEVFHADKFLTSKKAKIYPNNEKNKIKEIELFDKVRLIKEGVVMNGRYAKFKMLDHTGIMNDAVYRISMANLKSASSKYYAYGHSKTIIQEKENFYTCKKSTFTTCTPYVNSWHIRTSNLEIDQDKDMAYAKHNLFYIGPIPVFYLPYFSFPITNKRKSGFLYPSFNSSDISGMDFKLPYYVNIAPNYDSTLTPEYITKRGAKYNGEFRFLSTFTHGVLETSYIPKDDIFIDSINNIPNKTENPDKIENRYLGKHRGEVNLDQKFNFSKHFSGSLQGHVVSDDDYLQDFNNSFNTVTTNNISQSAQLTYKDPNWKIVSEVKTFQTLSPSELKPVVNRPYFILPKITVDTDYYSIFGILNISNTAGYIQHWNPQKNLLNQWKKRQRYRTKPSIEINLSNSHAFIKPKFAYHITDYNMYKLQVNKKTAPIDSLKSTKYIPIYSVDSGLILAKKTENYSQTLKARVMYSYIPTADQSEIKSIDSSYKILNYTTLFEPNRFSGFDRVGDTHQISYGLSTEIIPKYSSKPIFTTGIGQIRYFKKRKVIINEKTDENFKGYIPIEDIISPITAFANLQISEVITWRNSILYSISKQRVDLANVDFQYKSYNNSILNLGYTHIVNGDSLVTTFLPNSNTTNLDQFNASASIPINRYWNLYGGMSYNINADYLRHYFAGLEYNDCCWAVRLLGGKSFMGLDKNDAPKFEDKLYIQFVLKGLGSYVKDDVSNLLTTHIPGFRDNLA
ncbi:MAG: LPS-assembly protein LptD [Legionellales bacterium]|nr:LPS-assembly protein LptD [Legionellales bacterium]